MLSSTPTNRSGRPLTRLKISLRRPYRWGGIWIPRNPREKYLVMRPRINDDLPHPRGPQIRTFWAGSPHSRCSVLATMGSIVESVPCHQSRLKLSKSATGSSSRRFPLSRSEKAGVPWKIPAPWVRTNSIRGSARVLQSAVSKNLARSLVRSPDRSHRSLGEPLFTEGVATREEESTLSGWGGRLCGDAGNSETGVCATCWRQWRSDSSKALISAVGVFPLSHTRRQGWSAAGMRLIMYSHSSELSGCEARVVDSLTSCPTSSRYLSRLFEDPWLFHRSVRGFSGSAAANPWRSRRTSGLSTVVNGDRFSRADRNRSIRSRIPPAPVSRGADGGVSFGFLSLAVAAFFTVLPSSQLPAGCKL